MTFVSGSRERTLWAMAGRIVPPSEGLDEAERAEMLAIIEHAIGLRPPAMVRQLAVFLWLIRVLARARSLRRIDRMSAPGLDRLLRSLERSPISLLRKGFWGVKAIILMGYYTRERAGEEIGYRPRLRGGCLGS